MKPVNSGAVIDSVRALSASGAREGTRKIHTILKKSIVRHAIALDAELLRGYVRLGSGAREDEDVPVLEAHDCDE